MINGQNPEPEGTFIIGSPRSGTTLMQSIMASHSQFFSPPETSFFTRIVPALGIGFGNPDCKITVEAIDIIQQDLKLMTGLDCDLPSRLHSGMTSQQAFEGLMQGFNLDGKCNWVEKTTNHATTMGLIARYYPNARFIHLIRDPVDAVASMANIRPTSVSDMRVAYILGYHSFAAVWKACVSSALQYPAQHNVLHVHFEELVTHPETVVKRVCAFLGVAMEPEMLSSMHIASSQLFSTDHCPWQANNTKPGFHADAVHKWRRKLSPYDVWLIQRYTAELSRYFGYYEDLSARSKWRKLGCLTKDWVRRLVVNSKLEWPVRQLIGRFLK